MDFDRKTILAFVLIGLILIVANTSFYQKLVNPKGYEQRQQRAAEERNRTLQPAEPAHIEEVQQNEAPAPKTESVLELEPSASISNNSFSAGISEGEEKTITIETDLYKATLSTKGAAIMQWELEKYPGPDGNPVKLFPENSYGTMGLGFMTREGDSLDVSGFIYETDSENTITLTSDQTHSITFRLSLDDGRAIEKTYVFKNGVYDIDFNVSFVNMSDVIAEKRYYLSAPNGMASTEKRLKDDMMYAKAGTAAGGDVDKKYKSNGKLYEIEGVFDWVAVRTKYFAFYIIPQVKKGATVQILGTEHPVRPGSKERWKKYSIKLAMPYLGDNKYTEKYKIYLGPLEYNTLKKYGENMKDFMDFGMSFIKPFSLGILVVFKWMHKFIPNYGIVILIFSILIKILVYPLTHKSYESMQKMQSIQPKLKELQEKYKNDPKKLNSATMEMYKKEGVNPMGGCLPMLIQMPLLFGLFIIFRTTIELRGQGFVFWITDLSAPDTIYTFPGGFALPLYGNSVNILPLVMGVTMFFQQKMTVTDPKQKMMVYFMPIFLTLLFNSFPAGLNLYYALFNFLTIVQQKYLTPKKVHVVQDTPVVKKRKR